MKKHAWVLVAILTLAVPAAAQKWTVDEVMKVKAVGAVQLSPDGKRAVVFGGSGNGEAICANKVRGVRCALAWSEATARLGREHNDANVLALGARQIAQDLALRLVDIFLATAFEGGRHARRIAKLDL